MLAFLRFQAPSTRGSGPQVGCLRALPALGAAPALLWGIRMGRRCVNRLPGMWTHCRLPGKGATWMEGEVPLAFGPGPSSSLPGTEFPRCLLTQEPSRWCRGLTPGGPGQAEVSHRAEWVCVLRPGAASLPVSSRSSGPLAAVASAGVSAEFPGQPAPSLCIYWFSLNVPITQASSGHWDRNKSRKAAQPEAGNPIPPQRPEEAPVQSMPDHSGPHTPHGHRYGRAPSVHAHTHACIHTDALHHMYACSTRCPTQIC